MVLKRILLFGLSANPPTGKHGHLGIVEHFAPQFDEIWVLPVYKHMYASKQGLAPFTDRMAMCNRLFHPMPTVSVKDFEKTLVEANPTKQVGTYELVEYLQTTYPDAKFSLLLGGDTYLDLKAGKWNRGQELMEKIPLVVLHREGIENDHTVDIVKIPALKQVSSTLARATTDPAQLSQLLEPEVIEYIKEKKMYAFIDE